MAAQSFEDTIREIVKARLNPDTEALMAKKNAADAAYFGDPTAYNDTISAGVYNPADRRALLDAHRQSLMADSNTYGDALTNRDTSIDKVVASFAAAKQAQQQSDATAADNAYKQGQLAIDQQNANTSSSSSEKQNMTFQDQVNQLIAAGYPADVARTMIMSAQTGDTLANTQAYLKSLTPDKTTTTPTTGFNWAPYSKAAKTIWKYNLLNPSVYSNAYKKYIK